MNPDQIRALLQELLPSAGQQGQLTISHSTFNDDGISHVLDTCYSGTVIVIDEAVILPSDATSTQIVVTGTASFLNVAQMPITATFQESSSGIDMILRYQLPATWSFSHSFPTLPATWMPSSEFASLLTTPPTVLSPDVLFTPATDVPSGRSLLDLLTFTDASFIVTTSPIVDQVKLAAGLNFLCHLQLSGLLGAIEAELQFPDPLVLAGSIVLPAASLGAVNVSSPVLSPTGTQIVTPAAGIDLRADAQGDFSIGQMKLTETYIRFYSPLTSDVVQGYFYVPGMLVGGMLQIEENLSVEILAEKALGDDTHLTFLGNFEGLQLPSLSHLVQLVGADDLAGSLALPSSVPAFFDPSAQLRLKTASISVISHPFEVESVSVSVGLGTTAWHPLSDLSVEDISVYFWINNPFNTQRALHARLSGTLNIKDIALNMSALGPNFTITAQLSSLYTLPLQNMLDVNVPDLPAMGNLVINGCYIEVQSGGGFTLWTSLADQPQPLEITLGSQTLSLSDMQLYLNAAQRSALSGTLGGTLALAGIRFQVAYQFPGPLTLRGQFPSLSLKALVTEVCGSVSWPASFDIDLDQSSVLLQEQNSNFTLTLASDVKNLGVMALTLERQTTWGFALGVDLNVTSLAALPGLSMLAPFDAFIGLDALLMVFSSLAQPDFQFPDLANFNVSSIDNRKLTLPPQAGGLTTGLNLYAGLNTSKSGGFQALAKYLGIRLDGSVGITVAISLPDPDANSKFFLSVSEEIQKGTTLVGELGGFLQGSDVGAFLTATIKTQIQGQPAQFDVSAIVLENGVLISGTMQGTVHFSTVQLSNLALVIGIDLEGIPSLGIAAMLNVSSFQSSLALFFDSADPAKSLVAGSLSNLSLLDIARTFAGQASVPGGLDMVLRLIALTSLSAFSMPASTAALLDQRDVAGISNAFTQYGSVPFPATSDQVLLLINQKGTSWHLTDLSTMKHYQLALQGGQVVVSLEPQLYLAPQLTMIGTLHYPMGFTVIAHSTYLRIDAQITIQVNPQQGIAADVDLKPITLLNPTFFSITGANSQGGPHLSLATYSQPQLTDPQLRDPHLLISGNVHLLGADMLGIYLRLDEHGINVQLTYQVNPVLHVDLKSNIESHGNLLLQGGVLLGINRGLDLGSLGLIQVNTQVNGQLQVSSLNNTPSASFRGGFAFQGISGTIPPLTLDAQTPALRDLDKTLWPQISDILSKALQDSKQWLTWVHSGVIQRAGRSAEEVGQVLASTYHLTTDQIAAQTQGILGYDTGSAAKALIGAGSSADDAVKALKHAGYQTQDIVHALPGLFPNSHADTVLEHVDTPGGPRVSIPASHGDIPATHADNTFHTDVPGSHIDNAKHIDIPHTDIAGHTITPHGDSGHTDQVLTPHGDSNTHTDKATSPHGDTSTPHSDGPVPPHGDSGTHVDIKS